MYGYKYNQRLRIRIFVSVIHPNCLISVLGPTASGKTALSLRLATVLDAPIVSNDSRQFYKELKIGTARPDISELQGIPHYFLGDRSYHSHLSIGQYEREALDVLRKIFSHHSSKYALCVGGSLMYEKALVEGLDNLPTSDPEYQDILYKDLEHHGLEYLQEKLKDLDPEYALTADLSNPRRVVRALDIIHQTKEKYSLLRKNSPKYSDRNFSILRVLVDIPREQLYQKINERVLYMIQNGLEEEARTLYPFRHEKALQTVGYQEFFTYFDGEISFDECVSLIQQNTRRFAKRQLTWLRKMKFDARISPDASQEEIVSLAKQIIHYSHG